MLVLEINNLEKYFGTRKIFEIKDLKVYKEDKIGVVGLNGSGKTTLLNLIKGDTKPEKGHVRSFGRVSYIRQLEDEYKDTIEGKYESQFGLKDKKVKHMSGGEQTRLKIAKAFSDNPLLLLADEPTSNLDFEGIDMLIENLMQYDGALMVVSHDRNLLDKVCNKILEIEDGQIKLYDGNYSQYREQKELEKKTKEAEYQKYIREKRRLKKAIVETRNKSKGIRKTPRRMGNSEARLHKMGSQAAKRSLDNKIKALETRLNKLEVRDKVKEIEKIKVDILGDEIYSKVIIEGKDVNKSFGKRVLFKGGEFQIYNGTKTALIGKNGSGKTTLLRMIMNGEKGISISQRAKIGYFSQDLSILDEGKTIIENVMDTSIYDEQTVRAILARFLFKRDNVYKKVKVLSGGERVKASVVKILMSDFNMLIMDEPTNYLDIYSIEALEEALIAYEGTILFVSHDRRFIEKVADRIIYIEDNRIINFNGTLKEYERRKNKALNENKKEIQERKAILEYRMSEILGKLSMPSKDDDIEALDKEYNEILQELNAIRKNNLLQ